LADLVLGCEKMKRYTSGLDRDAFLADEKTYDAVVRNIEIIGEATQHVSSEACVSP
jgi:uncharacterized protein with HEPN domain